ncbi:MAG: hypothetical protein HeimC2_29590 [Candidatus Heimdallarchaeota archaeon LC_2]|nr:MAG: hypothetical protein HeimC2_29590 [Candidatus Heimdallarchaeota archaeon LC_2]
MLYEEKELLEGMRNCHRACGKDFEGTVKMVSSVRGREEAEVNLTLLEIAGKYGSSKEYKDLREKIPQEFPF